MSVHVCMHRSRCLLRKTLRRLMMDASSFSSIASAPVGRWTKKRPKRMHALASGPHETSPPPMWPFPPSELVPIVLVLEGVKEAVPDEALVGVTCWLVSRPTEAFEIASELISRMTRRDRGSNRAAAIRDNTEEPPMIFNAALKVQISGVSVKVRIASSVMDNLDDMLIIK